VFVLMEPCPADVVIGRSVSPVEVRVTAVVSPEVVAVVSDRVAVSEVKVNASDVFCTLLSVVVLLEGTGIAPPKFSGLVAMIELVLCVSVLTTT